MAELNQQKIGCVIAYANNHNNYGTSLQGYATLKKIQSLGYQTEVIRYNKKLNLSKKAQLALNMLRCGTFKGSIRKTKEKINKKLYKNYASNIHIRTKAVNRFKQEYLIPYFKEYNGFEALKKGSSNYNLVLVGSDQIWLPISLYSKYYNLLFVDDSIPKVAYASSFGVSSIPSFQQKATGNYLNRLDKIGVREIQGKKIVESISNKEATVVADPTLLLTKEEWTKEAEQSPIDTSEPYIFCYFLGSNKDSRTATTQLKKDTGLKIISIKYMDEYISSDESFGDEAPYDVSPVDFIKYIKDATYVCTDSFHGTIFSILFNKQFKTFYRFNTKTVNSRNSRIDSLFELLNLSDRLYNQKDINSIKAEIDYPTVNNKVARIRQESLDFLNKSLSLAK